MFFLSKSPGGHVISFQIKPWVPFGLPYLLIELFYIGIPVVRTDGRAVGRSVYGHVVTKFSRVGRLPHFLSYGAPLKKTPFCIVASSLLQLCCLKTQNSRTNCSFLKIGVLKFTTHQIWDRNGPMINLDAERFFFQQRYYLYERNVYYSETSI